MAYRLSEEHPLQPIRVKLAVELIRELGLVEFAELVPPRAAIDAEIETASFRTKSRQRDHSVLSARFLDPARHPVITFRSDRIEAGPNVLAGTLTVLSQTPFGSFDPAQAYNFGGTTHLTNDGLTALKTDPRFAANLNPTGAFKVRGGLNLLAALDPESRARGVVAASTGNHGQSVAYAALIFGAGLLAWLR